jgi:hypothetical protein
MQNIFVKPSLGEDGLPVLVRDVVDMQPLDPAGAWKPRNGYWLDRVRDGDVVDETASHKPGGKAKRAAK